jgi:rfaE bifunctional protein nucleotidyltransferase chain/domain
MAEVFTDAGYITSRVAELRGGGTLVLADGAFDLLHPGHVGFLDAAKAHGDTLVVALHSDAVVASNKGVDRPLNPWADRARVLAAVGCVDFVVEQPDRHLDDTLRALRPDVLAKGTDFTADGVRERGLVKELGGRVEICGGPKSHSTDSVAGRDERTFTPAWEGARRIPAEPGKITVIVLTRNEEHNIRRCLESANWADEIIVCDAYSRDRTPEIALEYTPNVIQHEYPHYGAQQNWVIPQAGCEWVLILDADERITPELRDAVQAAIRDDRFDGYDVARKSWFLGCEMNHAGWGRDYTHRLFRRDKGRYADRQVHADCIVDGPTGRIDAYFEHHPDQNLRNWFEKFDRYSSLYAADLFRKGGRARPWHFLAKPAARFFAMYVMKGGFRDGFPGLVLCGLSSMTIFARYAKLWEMNRRGSVGELPAGRP